MAVTKISIIVPIYNAARYIQECIDSILAQTFTDFELLLIDDGSIDLSGKICDIYAEQDSRVRVFHRKNGGVSSARNLGLDNAKGEYVIFMDADDYWSDVIALQLLYSRAKYFDLDIIRGEYKAVNINGELLFERHISKKKRQHVDKILPSSIFYNDILCGEFFLVLSLIKRDVIGEKRFSPNRSFLEDMEFYAKLLMEPLKCMYVSLRFYAYRKIAESASNTPKIKNLEDSFSMCYVFNDCSKIVNDVNLKKVFRYNSIMMYYYTLETLTLDVYYYNRKEIIDDLKLFKLQNNVFKWSRTCIWRVFPIFVYMHPNVGVVILRYYIWFKRFVHNCIHYCKNFIQHGFYNSSCL